LLKNAEQALPGAVKERLPEGGRDSKNLDRKGPMWGEIMGSSLWGGSDRKGGAFPKTGN